MAYYKDLSKYDYCPHFSLGSPLNVGWLDKEHEFNVREPEDKFLDLLWKACTISVAKSRGFHFCDLCDTQGPIFAGRGEAQLILGGAEIRVFSRDGVVFSAPNMIFHYVSVHNYLPPPAFVEAIFYGLQTGSPEYFERLKQLGLEWSNTTLVSEETLIFRLKPE